MTEPNEKYETRKRVRKTAVSVLSNDYGRVPPQCVDLEEAVLGALMLDKEAAQIMDVLKPEIFYKDTNQIIFTAIQNLFKKSEPIDTLTMCSELRLMGELETIGGPYYLTQLTNHVASAANIEYHARLIYEAYIKRELIHLSTSIIKTAFDDTSDCFDILAQAETGLMQLNQQSAKTDFEKVDGLIKKVSKELEFLSTHKDELTGIGSGFTEVDRITSGWQKTDLIILAARPGMGKTAFVVNIARNAAIDFNTPVGIFSLEMSKGQITKRLLSAETEIALEKFRTGKFETHEWEQYNSRIRELIEANLYIDDTAALSLFELSAKARRMKMKHKIGLIIVDYIQLMTTGEKSNRGNREQEMSLISRSLKAIAKQIEVPVIVLSQLSRQCEQRGGNKRPILSDLRDSGAIEQDADMVMFLYRPEYYKIDEWDDGSPTAGNAELMIAKHRNGNLKDVRLRFKSYLTKFEDLDIIEREIIQPNYNWPNEPQPNDKDLF